MSDVSDEAINDDGQEEMEDTEAMTYDPNHFITANCLKKSEAYGMEGTTSFDGSDFATDLTGNLQLLSYTACVEDLPDDDQDGPLHSVQFAMADADGTQYVALPIAGLAGVGECNTEDFADRSTPNAINLPMSKEDDAVLGISIFWRDEDGT